MGKLIGHSKKGKETCFAGAIRNDSLDSFRDTLEIFP